MEKIYIKSILNTIYIIGKVSNSEPEWLRVFYLKLYLRIKYKLYVQIIDLDLKCLVSVLRVTLF